MKNIFRNITINALILVFVLSSSSCSDFLDVEPSGSIPEDAARSDVNILEKLVGGLYDKYRGCKSGRNGLMVDLGNDESQQGNFQLISSGDQAGMDKYNGQLNPSSTQVSSIWDNRWPTVSVAANVIDAATALVQKDTDNKKAKQLLGEASYIRGILMYELSMYWGEIPILDRSRSAELKLGPQPLNEVWKYIINDLTFAADNLPESYNEDPKRATSGAALAMLGKAYMSAPESTGFRDFAKADDCFNKIINSGKYHLLSDYAELFKYDKPNSVESLYELQFSNLWPHMNSWEFDCGSRACDSWFGQECSFAGYDFLVPTPFAYRTVAQGGIWEDGDLRKEEALRYDFTYYTNRDDAGNKLPDNGRRYKTPDLSKTQWTGTTDELDPHIKKFEDYRTDGLSGLGINNMWNSGKNFAMIRYADVLLMHAECLNELGQTTEAVNIVNDQVRTRAWGGTLPADKHWNTGMSQDEFRDQIMDERMRELCFEGWRRIDLIRTNKFVSLIKQRNSWANQSGTIQEFHKRYPVPELEIKLNEDYSTEDQNPGYSK